MKYRYALKNGVFVDEYVELQIFDEKERQWKSAGIDEIWRLALNKTVLERKYGETEK